MKFPVELEARANNLVSVLPRSKKWKAKARRKRSDSVLWKPIFRSRIGSYYGKTCQELLRLKNFIYECGPEHIHAWTTDERTSQVFRANRDLSTVFADAPEVFQFMGAHHLLNMNTSVAQTAFVSLIQRIGMR